MDKRLMSGLLSVLLLGCEACEACRQIAQNAPAAKTPSFDSALKPGQPPQPIPFQGVGVGFWKGWPGPFRISTAEVDTGIFVTSGSLVSMRVKGLLNDGGFGGAVVDADGRTVTTPSDYPAPNLRSNSLICKVGSTWYQGGTRGSFTPTESGVLILRSNDRDLTNNAGGWTVLLQLLDPWPIVEILPTPVVILRFTTPYPSRIALDVDGTPLEETNQGNGYYTFSVVNSDWAATGSALWEAVVTVPPSKRQTSGFVINVRNISINPRHSGTDQTSAPLIVRILPARSRGTLNADLIRRGPSTSPAPHSFEYSSNLADPLAGTPTPHAIVIGLTLPPSFAPVVEHNDPTGLATGAVVGAFNLDLMGMEVEGAWRVLSNWAPPPLSGLNPPLPIQVEWVSLQH